MNDRFNIPLKVGDTVITLTDYHYVLGTVVKFTPKKVAVNIPAYGTSNYNSYNLVLFNTQHEFNQVNYPEALL